MCAALARACSTSLENNESAEAPAGVRRGRRTPSQRFAPLGPTSKCLQIVSNMHSTDQHRPRKRKPVILLSNQGHTDEYSHRTEHLRALGLDPSVWSRTKKNGRRRARPRLAPGQRGLGRAPAHSLHETSAGSAATGRQRGHQHTIQLRGLRTRC